MCNKLNFLTACVLTAGSVFAQLNSVNLDDLLREMDGYSKAAPAAKPSPAPAKKKPAPAVQKAAPAAQKAAPAEEPADPAPEAEPDPESTPAEPGPVIQPEDLESFTGYVRTNSEAVAEVSSFMATMKNYGMSLVDSYKEEQKTSDHKKEQTTKLNKVDEAWTASMVLRSYPLAHDAPRRMGLGEKTAAVDVGELFPGVPFGEEATAIYQPGTKTIFVHNTPANLTVIETMLEAMKVLKNSVSVDQVEIEAKFVEVSEGTLESLGFQWNIDGSVSLGGSGIEVNDGPGGLFANGLRGSPSGSSPGLPFGQSTLTSPSSYSGSGWSTFSIADTFNSAPSSINMSSSGGTPFDLMIAALDQKTGTDVLSAPRIVTRSGEEATIRVGERHFFPEVYEGSTSVGTIVQVSYEDWQETLLGIELSVTPEVDENEINLELRPRVIELAGWQEFQLAPTNSIYTHRLGVSRLTFTHDPIVARLPVLDKREIETTVRIADGSTIGMGGLLSEKVESYTDSVPVLGSIPLLGRLFRNEGERAVKQNLLMFISAKKVGPSGQISNTRSFE